ncbi:hypothetical protein [Candidatus Nitrospira bockiana]
MAAGALLFVLILLTACSSALKRDGLCLATLTPEYLKAQDDLRRLGSARASQPAHEALRREYDAVATWHEKVYKRLLTRLEEDHILTETFFVLLSGGPTVIFYPIVRWNVRSVFWEDEDPDAESDPVTAYCAERLSRLQVSLGDL